MVRETIQRSNLRHVAKSILEENISTWIVLNDQSNKTPHKSEKRVRIVYENEDKPVGGTQNMGETKVKPVTRIVYDNETIKSQILFHTKDDPREFKEIKYSFHENKDRPCSLESIPSDVLIIEVSMPLDLQLRILEAVYQPLKSLPKVSTQPPEIQDIAMALKYYLQNLDGPTWHVVVVIGQFSSFISHEPDRMFHFKVDRYIILVWKINRS